MNPTKTLLPLFFLFVSFDSIAQSQEKIYSVMMLNFAKGMQWPAASQAGSFIIGVLEYPPLASELGALSSNIKLGSRKIEIKEFDAPERVSGCHMLFIPAYKTKKLPDVAARLGTNATLIVTNKMDYAKKGAGINFVLVDGKTRFEINTKAIAKSGIKVSSGIKGLGILVE
ncbi:MAG TPA: YfiR family protein [Chryseosolibacter sp.]